MCKQFYLFLLCCGLLLTGCKSDSSTSDGAAVSNVIPTATISIDGEVSDWSGIASALSDPAGDQSGSADQDLTALYVAQDATYLYFRLSVTGNINMMHEAAATISEIQIGLFNYNGSCADSTNISGDQVIYLYSNGDYVQNDFLTYDDAGALTDTTPLLTSSLGSELEIRLAKSDLLAGTTFLKFTPNILSSVDTSTTQHDIIDTNNCKSL